MGSLDPDHVPLLKFFPGLYEDCPGVVQNFKSGVVDVLKLLAFNTQNFTGSCDPGHAYFHKLLPGGNVETFPGSVCVKFEVHIFSYFGVTSF